jgi:hypothetical protein
MNEWMTMEVANCFYPFDSNDFVIFEHMWWWLLHIKIVNSGYEKNKWNMNLAKIHCKKNLKILQVSRLMSITCKQKLEIRLKIFLKRIKVNSHTKILFQLVMIR